MIALTLNHRTALTLLIFAACSGPDPHDTDSTAGATSTSASSTTASTTASTTDGATSSGTTGASTTSASTTSATGGATTGALACDLVELTCDAAAVMGPVKDCGVVDPWNNTTADWQAAVDCALAAASAQQGFKLIVWLPGIDSQVGTGYYGVAAESYMVAAISYDSYPPASAVQMNCASLSQIAGCEVDVASACLSCDRPIGMTQLCGA